MGVKALLGIDPIKAAHDLLVSGREIGRRREAGKRVNLYRDNASNYLRDEIYRVFKHQALREKTAMWARLAAALSLVKRVADEIARPVYAISPTRTVEPTAGQAPFAALSKECHLDAKLDKACRLLQICNDLLLYVRVSQRLGLRLDIITPDAFSVIPDPDDPTIPLAVIYDRQVRGEDGKLQTVYTFWDDEVWFTIDRAGKLVGSPVAHDLARLPFVSVHKSEPIDGFFAEHEGEDLVYAQLGIGLLVSLVFKLAKCQGENQPVLTGDLAGVPTDQVLDGELPVVLPSGSTWTNTQNVTDPGHYLKTIDAISARVAANWGISIDRLDSKAGQPADDNALLERRAEAIKTFYQVEQDLFEAIKVVSAEHPRYRLSSNASMVTRFGEVSHRVDRMTQLGIWEKERSMGLSNTLEFIRSDNPEILTDDDAKKKFRYNNGVESERLAWQKAGNASPSATVENAGLLPAANGALGPIFRDAPLVAVRGRLATVPDGT